MRFATVAFFTVGAVLTYSPPGVLEFPCRIVWNGCFPMYSNTVLLDFVLDCMLSDIELYTSSTRMMVTISLAYGCDSRGVKFCL